MRKSFFRFVGIVAVAAAAVSLHGDESGGDQVTIAILADVHLLDLYGEFSDTDYKGIENPNTGRATLARSMGSQLRSTRLFNENYFAFLAALDNIVERKIRYVVLPGDFSDDGQLVNIRGLRRILEEYRERHGLEFILTTGNHDPVRPFTVAAGKTDFLGRGGRLQAIASRKDLFGEGGSDELPVVVTSDIEKLGYREILDELGRFGFFPQRENVYWETPFSSYSYVNYSFEEAVCQAKLEKRRYEIAPGFWVPDVSYLLEPEEGIWFLAIDANVYIPNKSVPADAAMGGSYGSASIGYNNTLDYKPHLFDWVASVMERAGRLGKQVVVFSHYPMLEFNDGATGSIRTLFGEGRMQLHRVPRKEVAARFREAGVRLHFGGHMHINDTSILRFEDGTSLVNVQVPSLAAYIPAYKVASFKGEMVDVKTVVINEVPRFRELFPLYEMEYEYAKEHSPELLWNRDILDAENYLEFTQWHLRELVRLRFLQKDWPEELRELLLDSTGSDLLAFAGHEPDEHLSNSYRWTGFDMIFDFYRLRSADRLALADVTLERLEEYGVVVNALLDQKEQPVSHLSGSLIEFARIFQRFMEGAPAGDFAIDLNRGLVLDRASQ